MVININSVSDILDRFHQELPFYPCCILAHPDISKLESVSNQIQQQYNWPPIAINAFLSRRLQYTAPKNRDTETKLAVREALIPFQQGTVVCKDIDLLFEPNLRIDPYRLFRDTSRHLQTRLVIMWPGTYQSSTLAYATPDHAHYRTWPQQKSVFIIQLS